MEQVMQALEDPKLRKYLKAEQELDAFEQRIFDLSKRVDALRPKQPNRKVRRAVKIGILTQQFDSRKRRTP